MTTRPNFYRFHMGQAIMRFFEASMSN